MIHELSLAAQLGIREFCSERELEELFESAKHDGQSCAWLWFLLHGAEDVPQWFPKGKWATLQRLETVLDGAALVELHELEKAR